MAEDEIIISFSEYEMGHVTGPREDALVITAKINVYNVKRVLIHSVSSTDVHYLDALKNMGNSENDI